MSFQGRVALLCFAAGPESLRKALQGYEVTETGRCVCPCCFVRYMLCLLRGFMFLSYMSMLVPPLGQRLGLHAELAGLWPPCVRPFSSFALSSINASILCASSQHTPTRRLTTRGFSLTVLLITLRPPPSRSNRASTPSAAQPL